MLRKLVLQLCQLSPVGYAFTQLAFLIVIFSPFSHASLWSLEAAALLLFVIVTSLNS